MKIKFIPSDTAREAFNLTAKYTGEDIASVLREALGEENYNKYAIDQDPLCGGKETGIVNFCINKGETNLKLLRFEPLGAVFQID